MVHLTVPHLPTHATPRYDFEALLNGDETDAATLCAWLIDSRERTRRLTDDLEGGDRELGPRLRIVNPPLWELAHVAWFQEFWCLRFRNGLSPLDAIVDNADVTYNSAIAAHDTRWELPLLPWPAMRAYADSVLERVLERIKRGSLDEQLRYFVLLSVFHEDMHGEAFYYTRQTLAYPRVHLSAVTPHCELLASPADVTYPGGMLAMGAPRDSGFAFDNELYAHDVAVEPFAMASSPVTFKQFEDFVNDDGYSRDALWSPAGRTWRDTNHVQTPAYWRVRDGQWYVREFDAHVPLRERYDCPMLFVNAFEAEAYCHWAQRRLPNEAEWEFAAHDQPPDDTSNAYQGWHWTADAFEPYPGFVPGPYIEYSAPWFGDHRALRGYAHPTRARMRRLTYRNFYTPDRRDVLAGLRTCSIL